MAMDQTSDSDSDSDTDVSGKTYLKPAPKRRRIIDPATVPNVPIYSNKFQYSPVPSENGTIAVIPMKISRMVSSSLQLKPFVFIHVDSAASDTAGAERLWSDTEAPPSKESKPASIAVTDSEEETEPDKHLQECSRTPSPPPSPETPVLKTTKRATKKITEINRKLNALESLLSPGDEFRASSQHDDSRSNYHDEDDDVIVISDKSSTLLHCEKSREIPLKFRHRTDVYKIPMQTTAPLRMAVDELSVKLSVPPTCILLLKEESELAIDCTVNELGLGIADIIDCVVMDKEKNSDIISVRLQGKEKGSSQEYNIHKDTPLGSVLSQYLSQMHKSTHKVSFLFDGSKVTDSQTPSQLGMEDGDVIEVWS